MPVIQGYFASAPIPAAPPGNRVNPAIVAEGADTVAAMMARVSEHFAVAWGQVEATHRQDAVEAERIKTITELSAAMESAGQENDPGRAVAIFTDALAARQQNIESAGLDQRVKAKTQNELAMYAATHYGKVLHMQTTRATERSMAQLAVTQDALIAEYTTTGRPSTLSQMDEGISSRVATNVIREDDGARMRIQTRQRAHAARAAVLGINDPTAALLYVTANQQNFEPMAGARLAEHFQGQSDILQGRTIGQAAVQNTGHLKMDARARAVHDAFVALGWPSHVGVAMAANGYHESGNQANPGLGDGGASSGLFQWNQGRRDEFKRQFGKDPHETSVGDQVKFADWELNNTERTAGDALRAASGAEEAAGIISRKYLRPANTENQATARSATAKRLSAPDVRPVQPDWTKAEAEVSRQTENMRPGVQANALTEVNRARIAYQHQTKLERAMMQKSADDINRALVDGVDVPPLAEADVRAVFEKSDADQILGKQQVAKLAGTLIKEIRLMSPAEYAEAHADLAQGQGTRSANLRGLFPPGEGDGDAAQYGMRQRILAVADAAWTQQRAALKKNPPGYVLAYDKVVAEAYKAINPAVPATRDNYVMLTMTRQASLGVPIADRGLLDTKQAESLVQNLMAITPDKGDARLMFAQLNAAWGDDYPTVFRDLIRAGMPSLYKILGSMDETSQTGAAAKLQAAILVASQPGGWNKVEAGVSRTDKTDIERDLTGKLKKFQNTTIHVAGGAELYAEVKEAVKLLSYVYASESSDGASDAMDKAVKGVLTNKYAFVGTWRVPKEKEDSANKGARLIVRTLDPAMLRDIDYVPAIDQAARKQTMLNSIRSDGIWVNNEGGTGIILTYLNQGWRQPVERMDGTRVEMFFNAIPTDPGPYWGNRGVPSVYMGH